MLHTKFLASLRRADGVACGAALLFALLSSLPVVAQNAPAQVDAALRARFGFLGPLRHKLGDGLDLLRVGDLDGDGRAEIVVEDPRRGRLVVLRADAAAERVEELHSTDTGGYLSGLALGDVGGDGSVELVLLGRRGRLAVRRLPGAEGEDRTVEVDVGVPARNDALRCADLDGDGSVDAVCLTQDGLRVVTGLNARPRVAPAKQLGEGEPRGLLLRDLDADRRIDVVLLTGDERRPLRVARGDGRGGFGPWLMFPAEDVRSAFPGPGSDRGEPTLVALRGNRGRIVDHALRRVDEPGSDVAVQFVALPPVKRGSFPFARGDFDGDGDLDFALAQPDRAELTFLLESEGRFEVETSPTLAGVSALAVADLDEDGRDDLVIASSEEKLLSWWSGSRPRDAFPQRLLAGVEPEAVAIEPSTGAVLMLLRDRRDLELHRYRTGADTTEKLLSLGRVSGSPQRLLCGELDSQDGVDLAVVLPGEGLRVLSGQADGSYVMIDPEAEGGVELASRIEDGAISITRPAADGSQSLWVVRERYARQLRLDAKGLPDVLRQVGVPAGASELSLGASLDDGTLLLVDRKSSQLFRVGPSAALVPVALPNLGATHVLAHGPTGDAVILGRSGVVRIPAGAGWTLEELRAHEPITDDTRFFGGLCADLDEDGRREVVVADGDMHGCHVFVAEPGALRRALAMPVFEPADSSMDVSEPRMMVAGDVDGDGRQDLVMVAFDHLLVYLQEP